MNKVQKCFVGSVPLRIIQRYLGGKKILYLKIELNSGDNIKMDIKNRMGGSEVGRVTQGGDQWELLVTEINFRLP